MRFSSFFVTPGLTRGPTKVRAITSDIEAFGPDQAWMPGQARHDEERGFTLVELMVVIVIIGLLATIVALNVLPSGDTARIQKAKADIATIESGLEMYKLQFGTYPTTTQGLNALVSAPPGVNAAQYQRGGYIKKLPDDPWNRPYLYAAPGRHGEADIWTLGRDGKDGGEGVDADIGSWQ